jgi:hypothetical protein
METPDDPEPAAPPELKTEPVAPPDPEIAKLAEIIITKAPAEPETKLGPIKYEFDRTPFPTLTSADLIMATLKAAERDLLHFEWRYKSDRALEDAVDCVRIARLGVEKLIKEAEKPPS